MATELRAGVYHVRLTGVNAYLVDETSVERTDGEELVLVDAGTPLDRGTLAGALADLGYTPADLDRVLLTHFDVDHAGGLARLATDAPIHAHPIDGGVLTRERAPRWNHKGLLQRLLRPVVRPPARGVRPVTDGDRRGGFDVVGTPGHTPGHLAFCHEAASAAFVGDLLVAADGDLRPSPWLLSDDVDAVRASIRDLADRLPPVEALCMGHGTPVTAGGGERLAALAARLGGQS